jgi:hypothetical protein
VQGLKSRSSPPRRRAGHAFWAPPPGRTTAARSPMGWTRAPTRGPAAAPFSSTEPPWVASSLLLAVSRRFGGGIGEGAESEVGGCLPRSLDRAAPPTAAGRAPAAGKKGRPPPVLCCAAGRRNRNEGTLGFSRAHPAYIPPDPGRVIFSRRSGDR